MKSCLMNRRLNSKENISTSNYYSDTKKYKQLLKYEAIDK